MAHVWVVEIRRENGKWYPTGATEDDEEELDVWRTKASAIAERNDITDFCGYEVEFRVAKYTREEED